MSGEMGLIYHLCVFNALLAFCHQAPGSYDRTSPERASEIEVGHSYLYFCTEIGSEPFSSPQAIQRKVYVLAAAVVTGKKTQ